MPVTIFLAHFGITSPNELNSNSSSTKWQKSSKVQTLFSMPNCQKTKLAYSIMIARDSSQIPKHSTMFICPFVLFKSAASFKQRAFASCGLSLTFFTTIFTFFRVFTEINYPERSTTKLFSFLKGGSFEILSFTCFSK